MLRAAWWGRQVRGGRRFLGACSGAVLVAVLMHGVFAELPLLLSWGLMGGGALMLALVGYNLTG
jgi:hypothetical protein